VANGFIEARWFDLSKFRQWVCTPREYWTSFSSLFNNDGEWWTALAVSILEVGLFGCQ
jgi:hypothetical protein